MIVQKIYNLFLIFSFYMEYINCHPERMSYFQANANSKRRLRIRSPDPFLPHSGQLIRFSPNGSGNLTSGSLEVFFDGSFTPVCTDGWDFIDGNVACKQLGFMRGALRILEGVSFGQEQQGRTKITKVRCQYSDTKLHDCDFNLSLECTTGQRARIECQPNPGCPEGWIAGPTGCYQITPNTVTRRQFAVKKCEARGGHLLNIDTEAEHNFLTAVFLRLANNGPLLTGGIRTGNLWVWEKMEEATLEENGRTLVVQFPIEFTKWFPGWQPGNISKEPSKKKKDRCLYLSRTFQHPNGSDVILDYLFWAAENCISTRKRLKSGFNYICERSLTVEEDVGCYLGIGTDYRGNANKTEGGIQCMNWKEAKDINPDTYPDRGLGNHSFCRNPDSDERPWCWTSADNFDFCNIPQCKEKAALTGEVAACKEDEFKCKNGSCIPLLWYCDLEHDCGSKNDEGDFCDYKIQSFRKTEGRTISHRATETYAGATNETCAKYCLEATKFVCQSFSYNTKTRECFLSEVNSDTHKTKSSRHETFYELTSQLDCEGMFKCENERCVSNETICDGTDDCGDFSDENSCDVQDSVEVRLRGGRKHEGRVEVLYRGEWGVVCDDRWDDKDAAVICRMLGYHGESEALTLANLGAGNGRFMLDEVQCLGNETSIAQCQHDGWKTHDCYDWETAGVRCTVEKSCPENKEFQCKADSSCLTLNKFCDTECDCPKCSDEDSCDLKLELVGGRVPSEGRVHVTFGDKNGTVCDDHFDDVAASVVCRSLGYLSGIAVESSLFGPGQGIVWIDNVICTGHEEHIIDCPHLGPLDNDCGHDEDVGVICREQNGLQVELVDGPNAYSGRVELIKDGDRGTVCDDEWDDADADVICKMLGFRGGVADNSFGPGSDTIHIFLDDVQCAGNEASIEECRHSDWLVHDCDHSEDAGVSCSQSEQSTPATQIPTLTPMTSEAPSKSTMADCFIGGDYKGSTSQTEKGLECQLWVQNSPHMHKYHDDSMFPEGSVEEARNYCRSPDGDPKPWCYTKDPDERWGYCKIPKCVENCYTIASDYQGTQTQTNSGKTCQHWNSDLPHRHKYHEDDAFPDGSVKEALNRCRAPDEDVTPWCYTTDSNTRWEYCDIPRCGGGFKYNVTCGLRPLQSRVRRDVDEDDFYEDDVDNPFYRRKGRIVGGSTASYGMIPWQVSIRLKESSHINDHSHHCGGILIDEYWVLSAAHCFRDVYKGQVVVAVGDHHSYKRDRHEQQFQVAALYVHERYKRYDYDYDIALLKIRPIRGRGVVFNDHVQPACIPDVGTLYQEGQKCIISGWGVYRLGRKSSYLKAARVPLVSYDKCNKLYKYSLTPRMTCAGYMVGGTDSCAGDSGGPLVCEINDKFTVMGVTSFGDGCGEANSPGVYTRVASFVPWIENILSENN